MLDRKQFDLEMDRVREKQIEDIADFLSGFIKNNAKIREMPVQKRGSEEILNRIEEMSIPRRGRDPREVGEELVNDILPCAMLTQHPRFLSFVCSAVSPYSLAGTVLTDIYNPNLAGFELAPGSAMVEEKLIRWMGSLAGFDPNTCGGLFTSGGSISNLTGMIAAREDKLPGRMDLPKGVAFLSDQAHSSLSKGMRMMGLRSDQIVVIPSDDDFRIRLDLLEIEIQKAIAEGKKPFLLVGTLGTTNTGSIDPFPEMAELADTYDMWFHVDGAYGGSVLFSDIYKNYAKGLEWADSMSWDTHKWSMQVYSCSCVIARDKQKLISAFAEHPEYLEDIRSSEHNDGWDLGIEMSRPARCIKLWYTLQAMGTDMLADVIDYGFYNAKIAAERFAQLPGWEQISKPMCAALNVRYAPESVDPSKYNDLNMEISNRLIKDGYAYLVTTVLKGKRTIRFCMVNGNTTSEDVLNTIERLDQIARETEADFR